jgi:hypothetical protein
MLKSVCIWPMLHAIGVALPLVLLQSTEFAAKLAIFANVIAPALIVQTGKVVVQSPVWTPPLTMRAAAKVDAHERTS